MPHASLRAMTEATFECYDAAVLAARPASTPPSLHAFSAARVRDALGYRAWTPPSRHVPAVSPRGVGGRIAHAAAAIRHKLPGRILYRLAPSSLVERLKRHL
jgi:hypothetical protein